MKTKRLQLMIMATLFLGVNVGGASVAQGATLQHKSAVVTKKPTPKSTVSTTNVSKVNTTKRSTFRPLVTKPAPKPVAKVQLRLQQQLKNLLQNLQLLVPRLQR